MNTLGNQGQPGFSLFEVLVALVILAIGMLGIAQMLLLTHKTNDASFLRQQAVQSAYDVIDRIHANRAAAISGNYTVNNLVTSGAPTVPGAPSTNCSVSVCSATQLATYDIWYWLASDVSQLPNGCGSITTAASGLNTLVTVTVQWDSRPAQQIQGITTPTFSQFIISSEL
ncbi:MAG: type IV pilus modification protein PilV [Legionellales bacterium]|nr:type IV pilus modification protein PilV [Legionellales bacterium]